MRSDEFSRRYVADGHILKGRQRGDGQLRHPKQLRPVQGSCAAVEPFVEVEGHVHEAVNIVERLVFGRREHQRQIHRLDACDALSRAFLDCVREFFVVVGQPAAVRILHVFEEGEARAALVGGLCLGESINH